MSYAILTPPYSDLSPAGASTAYTWLSMTQHRYLATITGPVRGPGMDLTCGMTEWSFPIWLTQESIMVILLDAMTVILIDAPLCVFWRLMPSRLTSAFSCLQLPWGCPHPGPHRNQKLCKHQRLFGALLLMYQYYNFFPISSIMTCANIKAIRNLVFNWIQIIGNWPE